MNPDLSVCEFATWRLDPDETSKPPHLRLIHLSPSKCICFLIPPGESQQLLRLLAYQLASQFVSLESGGPVSLRSSPPRPGSLRLRKYPWN
jgi:hypothetical protein